MMPGGATAAPLDLSGKTKAQLLEFADENGVSGVSSSMKKADIAAKIEEALS